MFVLYIFFWRRNEKYIKFENPLFNACLQLESNGSKPNVYEQSKKTSKKCVVAIFHSLQRRRFFVAVVVCSPVYLFQTKTVWKFKTALASQSLIHKNKINILRFHSLKLNFISFIKPKNKKKRNARNQNKTTSPTVIHWN